MNDGVEQQPQRIYEKVALLAFDLLARIIAMRIDTEPPFSALLTLWLSMMAAVGLASRSPQSLLYKVASEVVILQCNIVILSSLLGRKAFQVFLLQPKP